MASMGRPQTKLGGRKYSVRLDKEAVKALEFITQKLGVTQTQGIETSIKKFGAALRKKDTVS